MCRAVAFTLMFAVAVLAAQDAAAQSTCTVTTGTDNSLDRIVDLYRSCSRSWEATLGAFALQLFWLLAGIEFAWSAIRLAFRNADLNEWLAELVNQIFFLGFFLALLTNATAWTGAIVESFRIAATQALKANGVASGIAPSDIFDIGVTIATKMLAAMSITAPVQSLVVALAALIILVAFALMAAAIILALVESYVVLSAGVLLLGFGGSRWTKDFAVKILIYAISVGAKLFVLQLVAGLGAQVIGAWANLPQGQSVIAPVNATTNILIIVGSTLVLWVLAKTLPDMIQGLINGTALGMNTSLAGATASLAGSAYALGMVVSSARELAREQIDSASASGSEPPGLFGRTMRNIGAGAVGNIGERLSGRAVHGNRIGQVAGSLRRQADILQERRENAKRAAAPAASTPSGPTTPPPGQTPKAPGAAANNNDPNTP